MLASKTTMVPDDRTGSHNLPELSVAEERFDRALRPVALADYVGQPVVVEQLDIFIQAARKRDEPLDHTLVFGPRVWVRPPWPILLPMK